MTDVTKKQIPYRELRRCIKKIENLIGSTNPQFFPVPGQNPPVPGQETGMPPPWLRHYM